MGIGTKIATFMAGGKNVTKALSMIENVGDAVVFTDEEKSAAWLKSQQIIATQNSPTSISRRYIAWAVIIMVMALVGISVVCALTGETERLKSMIDIAKEFWIGEAFVSVIVFYFGPHMRAKK